MTPTRLVLVRHCEPHEDARGRCYGRTDYALCDAGSQHAQCLADELGREPFAALYTSPLLRARATAAPLGQALGLEPVVLDDLRELDFGELEGLPIDEIAVRYPELLSWTEAPSGVRFPGGESVAGLRARVRAAVTDLRARHRSETVAVVSHSLPIRAIVADALELPDDALFRVAQDFGGVSVVEWFGSTPLVRLVNGRAAALGPV